MRHPENDPKNLHTESVQVTPAQKELLELVSGLETKEVLEGFRHTFFLAAFCIDRDMIELDKVSYVYLVLQKIENLHHENLTNKLKTA